MSKFFSLAYLTLPNTHPVDQIEIAAQCGYEGVGLRTISQHLPGEPDYALANGRMFQMVRAALERTGVRLMDIELARVADGVDVMSYKKEFALGAELGAKYAIASVWSADRDFSRVQFEKMCDLADKYGMKLNLEFVPFSNIPGLTEALAWMDLMDRPNVQVLVDTLHAHRVKVTPEQLREVAAERFGFVHLCDGPAFIPPVDHPDMVGVARGGRLYVGEGGIDLAGMLKNIPDPPYYSIELPNAAEVAIRGKLEHARRCLETAKTFFAAHQI